MSRSDAYSIRVVEHGRPVALRAGGRLQATWAIGTVIAAVLSFSEPVAAVEQCTQQRIFGGSPGANATLQLCQQSMASDPAIILLIEKINRIAKDSAETKLAVERFVTAVGNTSPSLTEAQNRMLAKSLAERMATISDVDRRRQARELDRLSIGFEDLQDTVAQLRNDVAGSASADKALAGGGGNAIARLDLAQASQLFEQLAGIRSDLHSIRSTADLQSALKSPNLEAISKFPADESAVSAFDALLDDPASLKKISENLKSKSGLEWLGKLKTAGFDPNRVVSVGDRQRSLLYTAITASNVPMAIALLDMGASPYMYEELWGQEVSKPYFLYPLEVFKELSAADLEKKALLSSMIRAGLTISTFGTEKVGSTVMYQPNLGVVVPTQNRIHVSTNVTICKNASSVNYDWCSLVERLPSQIKLRGGGWIDEFTRADLVKPLAVINNYLYVLTYSPPIWGESGFGMMRISKDADQLIWYRYMDSAPGMGHCEELRKVVPWRPDGSYTKCWRRETLNRGSDPGAYMHSNYESVVYDSVMVP